MQRRSSRGQKGAGRKAKGMRRAQVEKGAAPASARSPIVSKPLIPAAKNGVTERASRGRGTVCRSVIISVHTCRAESLTKNLSMSAPRLTGRPNDEALVACGAHQIQTQGMCTREVGGRESGRGRERERAGASVLWRARMHNSPPRRWRRSIMLPASPRE